MVLTIQPSDDVPLYQPRSYQVEMFEASMKENIIVAMDTGSGKTNIALLRIRGELEKGLPQKLIWFLAPTVALCLQQYQVIINNIPAVHARTLTGLDKVELWTTQETWDVVLKDIEVVVSTHAVLADAMSHGFVRMSQLGLLIFDEAHHCMRRHPANKIMQDFYHPAVAKSGLDAVPRILGLTASPVLRSSHHELRTIETNLASVCKTPRIHRQELLKYTNRPQLQQIWFTPLGSEELTGNKTLKALDYAWRNVKIENDPFVKRLRKHPVDGRALQDVLTTGNTYCNEQLKKFVDRSHHIFEELGGWAVDYYIRASIEQLISKNDSDITMDWDDEERAYLIAFMKNLPISETIAEGLPISPKFEALLSFLDRLEEPGFSGIIFAKQRVTVSVLATLLSLHPLTKDRFRCAAYVGWSKGGRKDAVGDLLSMQMQRDTLEDFRSGRTNLIVATDVLEEGIDISACRVVVCYDKPPNLKSFVQRRGRARQERSVYAIMFTKGVESADLAKWQDLEKAMIEAYKDEEGRVQEAGALEATHEQVIERFTVESTGAVLTADTAIAHLHHFCAVMPSPPYANNRPELSFETDEGGLLMGKVNMPTSVHPTVRQITGKRWWKTERAAAKEAAFQTYKALYEFGLVNDNFLPLTGQPEMKQSSSYMQSTVDASEQYDPWADWADSWSSPDFHQTRIDVQLGGNTEYRQAMRLTSPTVLPRIDPITLFWDQENTFTLAFDTAERVPMTTDVVEVMRETTALYIQASKSQPLASERDFVTLFGPDLPHAELTQWFATNQGYEGGMEVYAGNSALSTTGLVRSCTGYHSQLLLFKRWLVSEEDPKTVNVECAQIPRRRNLLHHYTGAPSSKTSIVSASTCTFDRLPFSDTIFGLFISAITNRLEANLVATRLCETILQDVGFTDIEHVITAITAPVAMSITNYERYEFLGDSVLKFTVSCRLFFQKPNWHEGYLSIARVEIVQNHRLARAALDAGLDAFIINEALQPRKWSAPMISQKFLNLSARRILPVKTLADVVEALIGAAFLDGGYTKAQSCIDRFLPKINNRDTFRVQQQQPPPPNPTISPKLKEKIGYTFHNDALLLEALTHPSCKHDASTQSYQRLEFLGDAVLDMVVVPIIFHHAARISPREMTDIKSAVVNGNFLAFLCMEFAFQRETTDVVPNQAGGLEFSTSTQPVELWRFMRCQGRSLEKSRQAAIIRHRMIRDEVIDALTRGSHFPWLALVRLNGDKFFSDIIESILGAIFVDSGSDLAACEAFLERIGLLAYLRRILRDSVHVTHPLTYMRLISRVEASYETILVQDDDGDATYSCSMIMGGGVEIVVEGCLTREEAEVRAANKFIRIFKERNECADEVVD